MNDMKKQMKFISRILGFVLVAATFFRCEDDVDTMVSGIQIEDADLIQVEDASPSIPVSFTVQDANLQTVTVQLLPEGSTDKVFSATLKGITADNLNRVKLSVPFPTPDVAPSGVYNVKIAINGNTDGNAVKSYKINVLNNRTIKYCDFPTVPSGKVGIFVSVPGGADVAAAEKDIFIVGNFMAKNGAAGDWNPGDEKFKLTKLSEKCYYIFLDKLDNGDEFKFTLGTWDEEFLGAKGESMPNQVYKGGVLNLILYNFKTLPVKTYAIPEVLPAGAIQSGKITAVVNVNSDDADSKYYLVKKGATSLQDAVEMVKVTGTQKFAGAVPKLANAEYIVVKNTIDNVAANAYGYELQGLTISGNENPVSYNVVAFKNAPTVTFQDVIITGAATPSGWTGTPPSNQVFTKVSDGKYTLTLSLNGGQDYLLLPGNNGWDLKWGKGADATPEAGNLLRTGSAANLTAPAASGTYKIDLDFTKGDYGVYVLTKQ